MTTTKGSKVAEQSAVPNFLLVYPSTLTREFRIALAMLFVLVLFRYRAISVLNTHFIGGFEGDAGLYIWLMKHNLRDLISLPWFNTRAFYPYTQSLAWSDNFILPSILALPFVELGIKLPLIYNLIILFAEFLNGYVTYRLCFLLCGFTLPSFIAGAAFMSLAYFGENLGHPQLQFAFWIPLALICFFRFLERPNILYSFLLGLIVFFTFLTTVYFSIFIIVAIKALLLAVIIIRPRQFRLADYIKLSLGPLIGFSPIVFFVGPYLAVRETFGERAIYEAYYFSATALSYVSSSSHSIVYGWSHTLSHVEAHLFPGLLVLGLSYLGFRRLHEARMLRPYAIRFLALLFAVLVLSVSESPYAKYLAAIFSWGALFTFGLLLYRMGVLERKLGFYVMTQRGLISIFLFASLLLFLISLGPLGNPAKGEMALGVFRLFYEVVPGFNSMRAISRIGMLCSLTLIIGASLLLAHFVGNRRVRSHYLIALLLVILLENLHFKFPLEHEILPPQVFNKLASLPHGNEATMILPFAQELDSRGQVKSWGDFARLNVTYMHWAFPFQRNLVNGYSGQKTKLMRELPKLLSEFPDALSIKTLRSIGGLRYIVYCSKLDPEFNRETFDRKLGASGSDLNVVEKDLDGNYLFELGGETLIDEDFYLLVPSHPSGVVHVDLKALFQAGEVVSSVNIFAKDHMPNVPLSTAQVQSNGKWETYTFALPKTSDSVRPIKLTFETPSEMDIFVGRTLYQY